MVEASQTTGVVRSDAAWDAEVGSVRLHCGAGRLSELGELARQLGARRALLVTDPGLTRAGHAATAARALAAADLEVFRFDDVEPNPTTATVDRGCAAARDCGADLLVALGGGSAMDCAKGVNLLMTNGGAVADYEGFNRAPGPYLPSIAVPTTAGTGSEGQSYALIADARTHRKMACGDPGLRFREVILDPELLASAPREVIAAAGLDALSHAIESFVSKRANPVSRTLSKRALEGLLGSFSDFIADPSDETAGIEMMISAHFAGAAIENSMLGAAHAAANPLTARHGVVHGMAVALTLPVVIRWNAAAGDGLYDDLVGDLLDAGRRGVDAATRLADEYARLRGLAGAPSSLSEVAVPRDDLPLLASQAAEQWTARFNPRPITSTDFLQLYESID